MTDAELASERRGQTRACAETAEGVLYLLLGEHGVNSQRYCPVTDGVLPAPHAWLVTPAERRVSGEVAPREFISTGLKSYGALGAFDD